MSQYFIVYKDITHRSDISLFNQFPNLILEYGGQRRAFWQKGNHATEQVRSGNSRGAGLFIWSPSALWEELPTNDTCHR